MTSKKQNKQNKKNPKQQTDVPIEPKSFAQQQEIVLTILRDSLNELMEALLPPLHISKKTIDKLPAVSPPTPPKKPVKALKKP